MLDEGSKATLILPSYLGYGFRGNNAIPANTVLLFEVGISQYCELIRKEKMLRVIYPIALCLILFTFIFLCEGEVDCGIRPELDVDQTQLAIEIAEIEAY